MPQLDTIYTFMIYLWTWLSMHMVVQKIKTFSMTKLQKNPLPSKPTHPLPWL